MEKIKSTSYYNLNIGICPFDNNDNNENKKYNLEINTDIALNYSVDVSNEYFNKIFQDPNTISKISLSYYPNNITQEDIDEDQYNICRDKGTLNYHNINFEILENWFPEDISIKNFKVVVKMPNPVWYSKIEEYQFDNNPYGNYAVFEMSNYDFNIDNNMNFIEISKIHFYDFSENKIKEIKEKKLTKYEDIMN